MGQYDGSSIWDALAFWVDVKELKLRQLRYHIGYTWYVRFRVKGL